MNDKEKAKEIAVKWKAKGLPYNAIYDSCLEMAQWKQEQLIEKAVEWFGDYIQHHYGEPFYDSCLFKKAMEGE